MYILHVLQVCCVFFDLIIAVLLCVYIDICSYIGLLLCGFWFDLSWNIDTDCVKKMFDSFRNVILEKAATISGVL